jgi:hypothetical protein
MTKFTYDTIPRQYNSDDLMLLSVNTTILRSWLLSVITTIFLRSWLLCLFFCDDAITVELIIRSYDSIIVGEDDNNQSSKIFILIGS